MVVLWFFFAFFFDAIYAHIRLVEPAPRTTGAGTDGLKSYPCGGPAFGSGTSTPLAPGKQWIKFEHAGSPFRIALSIGSDDHFDQYILADQVPHNDDATGGNIHAIEVDIPDIDCPKCALQIINIMTDKETGCCPYPDALDDTPKCSSVYHSCADISITGTQPTTEYQHEREYPCGQYAPDTKITWTLDNGVWKAPSFDSGDLPNTCGVRMCSSVEEPEPEPETPELPPVTNADKAKAHFILTLMGLKRATDELEAVLEEQFVEWGFDANDADDLLDNIHKIVDCTDEVCQFDVTFEFDVDDTATVDAASVCDAITEHFKESESKNGVNGEWTCDAAPKKRDVRYETPLTYTETEMLLEDDTEARFVLTLYAMNKATEDVETVLETAFDTWSLDTKDADNILDDFDITYSCSNGKCEIPINLAFTVDSTETPLEDDDTAQDEICDTFTAYFVASAQAFGSFSCQIVKNPDTEEYWAQVTYSEGDGGLSGAVIFGIVIAVLLGVLVVVVLVALIMSKGGSNHDRV